MEVRRSLWSYLMALPQAVSSQMLQKQMKGCELSYWDARAKKGKGGTWNERSGLVEQKDVTASAVNAGDGRENKSPADQETLLKTERRKAYERLDPRVKQKFSRHLSRRPRMHPVRVRSSGERRSVECACKVPVSDQRSEGGKRDGRLTPDPNLSRRVKSDEAVTARLKIHHPNRIVERNSNG